MQQQPMYQLNGWYGANGGVLPRTSPFIYFVRLVRFAKVWSAG